MCLIYVIDLARRVQNWLDVKDLKVEEEISLNEKSIESLMTMVEDIDKCITSLWSDE